MAPNRRVFIPLAGAEFRVVCQGTISVPPNVPVREVAPQKVTFSPGDVVYPTSQQLPDGTFVTDKIFQFIPAASSGGKSTSRGIHRWKFEQNSTLSNRLLKTYS
jgi:hypothetical protein